MPTGFMNLNFHAAIREDVPKRRDLAPPAAEAALFGEEVETFESDESAARFYLDQEMMLDERPAMQALMSPDEPEVTPDLAFAQSKDEKLTGTKIVQFQQIQGGIPVFGSSATVELTEHRELVAIDAELADPAGLSAIAPVPTLSPADALRRIETACSMPAESLHTVKAPELTLFHDDEEATWHLAYHFSEVPAAPPEAVAVAAEEASMAMLDPAPQALMPLVDYLVDAHSGEILYYYSAYPTAAAAPRRAAGRGADGLFRSRRRRRPARVPRPHEHRRLRDA